MNRNPWLLRGLKIAGTVLLLVLILRVIPGEKIWEALRRVPPGILAPMAAVFLAVHCLGALKWHLLVNLEQPLLPIVVSLRCYLTGLFTNTALPSVIGGDAMTAAMGMRHSSSKAPIVVGTILHRLLDSASLALLVAAGAWLLPSGIDPKLRTVSQAVLTGAAVISAGALAGLLVARSVARWPGKLEALRDPVLAVLRKPGRVMLSMAIGVLMQACFVGIGIWIGSLCGLRMPAGIWLFAWPLAKLAALIPVSIGGLGAREVALAGLLAPFGVEAALAVSVSLVFSVLVFVGNLLAGAAAFVVGRASR